MKRKASAVWNGGLKEGKGTFSVGSGVIDGVNYDFGKRFGDDHGTNPEELIAAAHAACFSMAFSAQLGERQIVPESIETTCAITMENLVLTSSVLTTTVRALGADRSLVEQAASAAKTGCPVSRVLNLEVSLDLTVVT